jgi:hypothetical protein
MLPDQERRLEEISSAARDLPPSARAGFLDGACGGRCQNAPACEFASPRTNNLSSKLLL